MLIVVLILVVGVFFDSVIIVDIDFFFVLWLVLVGFVGGMILIFFIVKFVGIRDLMNVGDLFGGKLDKCRVGFEVVFFLVWLEIVVVFFLLLLVLKVLDMVKDFVF